MAAHAMGREGPHWQPGPGACGHACLDGPPHVPPPAASAQQCSPLPHLPPCALPVYSCVQVTDFLEKETREERQGLAVEGVPDADLFFIDKVRHPPTHLPAVGVRQRLAVPWPGM